MNDEISVLEALVKVQAVNFSRLVAACLDADKQPQAPSKKEIMWARSLLPPGDPNTLTKVKEAK